MPSSLETAEAQSEESFAFGRASPWAGQQVRSELGGCDRWEALHLFGSFEGESRLRLC